MYTLFISTYNEIITIALFKDGVLFKLEEVKSQKSHSTNLVPMISRILLSNNLEPKNLNEILVINGPGSFTGLRLGITVAKTLAYTLSIPIKAITSIEALSLSTEKEDKIVTIADSKGKYIGKYVNKILTEPIFYLSDQDFNKFIKDNQNFIIVEAGIFNYNKIYEYTKSLQAVNPHSVKAMYVKKIEALNDK